MSEQHEQEELKPIAEDPMEDMNANDLDPSAEAESTKHEFGEAESTNPLEELQRQVEEEKNKYLRVYAEFENFRRRSAKERRELIATASAELMKEIIPVLDDFERAIELNKKSEDLEAVKSGFDLLYQKLSKTLHAKGLQAIESKGQPFDAEFHEAIAQVPAPEDAQKGIILDVIEKGYTLNDKIVRHPKVVVGS